MATYKVPQDVEADDKLIGPFSFRQFIYLIIVAMAGALAWGLGTIFIGLAIIPLPVILLFGALALPLRKDQPMEIYLAALVSFYLKPRNRLWDPEGVESMIEITAPKTVEVSRVKDLSQGEAVERLSYLANLVDTQGWAIRGTTNPQTAMNTDMYLEAQGVTDVLDTSTSVAQNFDQMMAASTVRVKEEARARMMQPQQPAPAPQQYMQPNPFSQAAAPTPVQQPAPTVQAYTAPAPVAAPAAPAPVFNPYPNFDQAVIQPLSEAHHAEVEADTLPPQAATPVPTVDSPLSTSDTELSAGIMNLANNSDLSIETIASEANRLKKKAKKKAEEDSGEVIISLR